MTTSNGHLEAVHNLVGITLPSGWKVVSKKERRVTDTGGCFSVCYHVVDERGVQAFMKVLNLARVLAMPGDQLKSAEVLIAGFNFERAALDVCSEFRLRRVALAIEHGKLDIPGNPFGVYYIIFEKADGDIRRHMEDSDELSEAWILKSLHQCATGLWQLHRRRIAHQDLKPSNILFFGRDGAKVSDLGSSDIEGKIGPRSGMPYAGDPSYAPLELLYGEISLQWENRRFGADMYLFGSLITFVLAQVTMTSAILLKMHPQHRPGIWPHGYRTVLPYVRQAFGEVMAEIRPALTEWFRPEMGLMIEQLCEPDPNIRGVPRDLNISQFTFERYVSILGNLAKRAEMKISG